MLSLLLMPMMIEIGARNSLIDYTNKHSEREIELTFHTSCYDYARQMYTATSGMT